MRRLAYFTLFLAVLSIFCGKVQASQMTVVFGYPSQVSTGAYQMIRTEQWVISSGGRHTTPLYYTAQELSIAKMNIPLKTKFSNVNMGKLISAIMGQKKDSLETAVVHFDFDKSSLKPSEKRKLNQFASRCKNCRHITITGYTDDIGTEAYNLKLGERRAKSVEKYLKSRLKNARFETHSRGKYCFIRNKDGSINRRLSRRAEVVGY